jgi:hypothetical protein
LLPDFYQWLDFSAVFNPSKSLVLGNMKKQLKSYKQLLDEKEKLHELLQARRQLIYADVEDIKVQLKPLSEIRQHITKFTTRDKLNLVASLGSDVIVKNIFQKFILARAGRIAKMIVPYFIKNYTSSFLGEEKEKVIKRIKALFRTITKKQKKKDA